MANFEPKWDIRADQNTIIEGQEMFVQVDMSNFRPELTLTEYTINDNQYIEFELTISSTGNTTKESDYIIEVGESKDTLENINDLSTGSSRMYGTHKIKIKGKSWKLASSTSTIGFYFIKLSRPKNGVWNSESELSITMSQPRLITILNNQEAGNNYIGVQGNTKATITYDNSSDIWVTPDLLVYGKQKYTIGAISYGADSRLFVQAFGKAKDNKVFVPAYEMVNTTDIPTDHVTGSGTVLKPKFSTIEGEVPAYPINKSTTGGMSSFYMENVALNNNNAGCLNPMDGFTSDVDTVYVYAFKVVSTYTNYMTIFVPDEAEIVNVYYEMPNENQKREWYNLDSAYFGKCDIFGNITKQAERIHIKGGITIDRSVFIQIKMNKPYSPPWVSFTHESGQYPNKKVLSTSSLNGTILFKEYKTFLTPNDLFTDLLYNNTTHSLSLFDDINQTPEIKNDIKPRPKPSESHLSEETPVTIKATNGNDVLSGLSFMSNGQLVKTLLYQSEPVDAYFTAKIVSIKKFYSTDKDAYKLGKRFRAYQMFVAPMDVSYIKPQPKAGHLYILRDTKVYPYVVKESDEEGKLLFEENVWIDLGVYDESIASSIIGSTKRFRILVNSKIGSEIEFETEPNLGTIHVGEYFGHTVMPVIKAKGDDLITYKINKLTSPDDIEKYNLHLSPDGTLLGTAFANATDFGEKDEINLEFDVVAMARSGLSNTQRFKISIVRGMGANYLSAYIKPTLSLERKWFQCVSSENFNQARYFRASDPRYGLQSVPRMLLKENYYNSETAISSTRELKRTLRNNIISKLNVPTSMFQLVLGNYKVRSAMDNQGNVLYDLLYREVHPVGITIGVDKKYRSYTPNYNNLLIEIYGLRENIYRAIGEDTRNLLKDPDDLKNRAVQVKGIEGISTEMLDTVPRYMSHPYEDVLAEYVPIIPVAYLQAGTAEAFMLRLQQSGEHKAMVGEIFDVYGVEFDFFHLDNEQYVQDSFMITLPSQKLGE